jgi:hypothetical protein
VISDVCHFARIVAVPKREDTPTTHRFAPGVLPC